MFTSVIQKIQTVIHHQEVQKNLEWMDTLTNMDELDALKETTVHIAQIKFDRGATMKRQLDVLLEIDQKTYREAKRTTIKYLNLLKSKNESEVNIYNAVYSYQRQLYLAYTQFLDFYQAQTKIVLSDETLTLALARLLNATFSMTKWRYFDDQPAPQGTWTNVCKVIKCAENLSLINTNLFLYEHQKKETSLASLLKQGFMMSTLHKGNYSRLQIQLTDQILKVWATNPILVNKFKRDKHHFFINMDNDRGPERIRSVEKFSEYRFWRVTRLIDLIEAYLCAANTDKALAEFGLEKMASTESLVKLFKKLRVDWCAEGYERQRRKETRFKKNKLIHVTYGLNNICRLLGDANASLFDKPQPRDSFEFEMKLASYRNKDQAPSAYQSSRAEAGSENWWLVDESEKGIGVELGKTYSKWIEAGKLIAYTSPENKKVFVIAEIKSVRKQANGNYRAGLEIIGTHGTSVKIGRLAKNNVSGAVEGYYVDDSKAHAGEINVDDANAFVALLLDQQDDIKLNRSSLIVPRSEYKRGSKFVVKLQGNERVLEMGMPLTKQREWVRMAVPA
jgi:hypothetical protein